MIKEINDVIDYYYTDNITETKPISTYEVYLEHSSIDKIVLHEKEFGYMIKNGEISCGIVNGNKTFAENLES